MTREGALERAKGHGVQGGDGGRVAGARGGKWLAGCLAGFLALVCALQAAVASGAAATCMHACNAAAPMAMALGD